MVEGAELELFQLVELLEPTGVAMLVPPPRSVFVRGADLHDGPLPATPGNLIFAIGMRTDGSRLTELCREAAASGQAAVAVKSHGRALDELRRHALEHGIALLVFPDRVAWSDVYSMLSVALQPGATMTPHNSGEDLFALADSIAGVFGSSVAIEDLSQTVVGYSSLPGQVIDEIRIAGILGRRVPQSAAPADQYQQVYSSDGIVRFPRKDEEEPRAAIAVRAGVLPIGSVWAIEPGDGVASNTPLDEECARALTQGALLAAPYLMRAANLHEPEARQRRAVFDALLANQSVSSSELAVLGNAEPLTVTAIVGLREQHRIVEIARFVDRQYRALRPRAVVSTSNDRVYVLTPGDGTTAARRIAHDVISTAESALHVQLCAAIGSPVTASADIPAARDEVDAIVRCLRSGGQTRRFGELADVRARLTLLACLDRIQDDPYLHSPGIALMTNDDNRATYGATTLAWLDNACSISTTARALHVHENTVRYRLSRVSDLFGIDLDDPETRMTTWISLRGKAIFDVDP